MDTSNEDFAISLSRFAGAVSTVTLPASAIAAAKTNVFDTLACVAAGSSAPAVAEARGLAVEWGGTPQATILVFGDKVPAHHAAWINGTMAHALDYDDTHDAAVLHAGVSVVPAALAAAELAGHVSGADFISGVAAGLETICRLGVATKIGIIESGFIFTPLFGYFAATIAAARVLKLDEAQTVNAIGIVYSQVSGNHQVTRDAALTKRMQPGFAAMSALLAVQLARRGVRGAQSTFDGVDGFIRVYLRGKCDGAALREGLGRRYEFTQLSYKPYPCCRFNHNAIRAALTLRQSIGKRVGGIERVRVGLNRQAFEAGCTPTEASKAPTSVVQAQFSTPYTVAAALLDGSVRLVHFTEAALQRQDILALAQKVEPYIDQDIERDWGSSVSPALVRLEMNDGGTHHMRIDVPLGHPSRPLKTVEFDAKAHDCFSTAMRPMRESAPLELRRLVDGLEGLDDVGRLVRVLEPANCD